MRRPAGSGYSLKRVVKLPGSNLGRGDKTKEAGRAEMNERTTVREYCNLWLKLATQKRFREPRGGKKERKRAWYICDVAACPTGEFLFLILCIISMYLSNRGLEATSDSGGTDF